MKHEISAIWPISEDEFLSSDRFERVFVGTMDGLNKLLPARKGPRDPERRRDPIGRLFKAVRKYHQDGFGFARDWEAFRLGLLALDLEALRTGSPDAYRAFRRAYARLTFNEFFGWRHEVRIAAHLTAKRVEYLKTEAPDFEIVMGSDDVYAECASTNVVSARPNTDLAYKLQSAILAKAQKSYCNRETILLLDYTNVLHNSILGGRHLEPETVGGIVSAFFPATDFGAILATALLADLQNTRFVMAGALKIADNAPRAISEFLDALDVGTEREVLYTVPFSV